MRDRKEHFQDISLFSYRKGKNEKKVTRGLWKKCIYKDVPKDTDRITNRYEMEFVEFDCFIVVKKITFSVNFTSSSLERGIIRYTMTVCYY